MNEILAVSIPEAGRRIGVCPRTITNLIRAKELTSRKIGRRRVIPITALEAFLRHDHLITVPVATHALDGYKCAGSSPPSGDDLVSRSARGGGR